VSIVWGDGDVGIGHARTTAYSLCNAAATGESRDLHLPPLDGLLATLRGLPQAREPPSSSESVGWLSRTAQPDTAVFIAYFCLIFARYSPLVRPAFVE
jgi:hypothetical protein